MSWTCVFYFAIKYMNTIPSVYKSMFCLGLGYDTPERHQFRRKKLMKRKRHKTTYTKMEAKKNQGREL